MIELQGTQPLRQRTGVLFVLVLVGHLLLISAQVQSGAGVPVLEAVTFGLFSRVQLALAAVVDVGRNGWGNYVGLRGARAENEILKRQLADLEVRMQEQRALVARTGQLQQLLDLQQRTSVPTIAAEVIAGNPNPGILSVTVNRGSRDGVTTDMAVISPKGIVGRVVGRPAAHAARVQLLIDPAAAAAARIERSRAGGMVAGVDADPPLQLQLVSNLADVIAGDTVVSSGTDGVYPAGFAIGTVEKSERGPGLYRAITVRPVVDFSSIEEVLIVLIPARPASPRPESAALPVERAK
ncbi:MAG: rod shape-determining protein MreC [Vicinamibacterales bacterium]